MFQTPHPRNDQSVASASSRGQLKQPSTAPLSPNSGCLPQIHYSAEDVDEAKRHLMKEMLGVSYRDVAADIAQAPWTFGSSVDFRSASLTKRLIQFSPSLAAQYNIIASDEGFLAKFLAAIPVVGLPLQSSEFLRSLGGLNGILEEMLEAGLIEIQSTPPTVVPTGQSRFAPSFLVSGPCRVRASDLCRIALTAE